MPVAVAFRDAWRRVTRSPLSTLVMVATLAVAIGPTVVVAGLVDVVFLRHLPYPDADRLVSLQPRWTDRVGHAISGPVFDRWRTESVVFEVSPAVFPILGSRPARGRLLRQKDEEGHDGSRGV